MSLNIDEQYITFVPKGLTKSCKTYYKIVTSPSTEKNTNARPLLILHGGPFLGHDYCVPLQELAHHPQVKSVIFYDQLGCGKSTHFEKDDTEFTSRFWETTISQLKNVIHELKLVPAGFFLFGHSLGTILAATVAGTDPDGIQGLVLSNALVTASDFRKANLQIFQNFPPDIQHAIVDFEEFCTGQRSETSVSVEKYLGATNTVRLEHFNRAPTSSKYFDKSMENVMEVMDVFAAVSGGRIQFLWGGPVAEHSSENVLSNIRAPTLVIKGEYDQGLAFCQEPLMKLIQNVKEATLTGASHMVTEEAPDELLNVVSKFLSQL